MAWLPCWARSERAVEVDGDLFLGAPLDGLRSSGRIGCGDTTDGFAGGLGLERELDKAQVSGAPGAWPRIGGGTAAKRWSCGRCQTSMRRWSGTVACWSCHLEFLALFEVGSFELREGILCILGMSCGGILETFLDTLSRAILRFLLDRLEQDACSREKCLLAFSTERGLMTSSVSVFRKACRACVSVIDVDYGYYFK